MQALLAHERMRTASVEAELAERCAIEAEMAHRAAKAEQDKVRGARTQKYMRQYFRNEYRKFPCIHWEQQVLCVCSSAFL